MSDEQKWKYAERPNYVTNTDRKFPYSEVPILGQYNLVKIPAKSGDFIDHVNYWGEGKIESWLGISGFPDCYNVNYVFGLVSDGPDKGRKIPNRIPVPHYIDCDTSAYIRAHSVVTVTSMAAFISCSCARDIARIVNKDKGKVILYGFSINSVFFEYIRGELEDKSLYYYSDYNLPTYLQGITRFDLHHFVAFVNVTILKDEIYKFVMSRCYYSAVELTKKLNNDQNGGAINEVVLKLLKSNMTGNVKLMSYAYMLWDNGAQGIVKKHFPDAFTMILGKEKVVVVNHGYDQALKLDVNMDRNHSRQVWGHNGDKNSNRLIWQFIPVWLIDDVTFKLFNVDCDMYLKLDETVDMHGDRKGIGSKSSVADLYYVEPYFKDGNLLFIIMNYQYQMGLKLSVDKDSNGDRMLWGNNGNLYEDKDGSWYKWKIVAWTSS